MNQYHTLWIHLLCTLAYIPVKAESSSRARTYQRTGSNWMAWRSAKRLSFSWMEISLKFQAPNVIIVELILPSRPVLWHIGSIPAFTCIHILKQRPEKNNIFDPTPSSQVSYKVRTHHCAFIRLERTLNRKCPANGRLHAHITLSWKW